MPEKVCFYNTLSRNIEQLNPIKDDAVSVYCCGPTVYNYQHIGNLRTYIFEDILIRVLKFAGYEVTHVMNITDVGHLVSDADEGEDKMSVAAKREKKSSLQIAEHYTNVFFEHCDWLNILRPNIICRATKHIAQMIDLIKRLEERGFAYIANGNVYFDTAKLPDYGKLARLDLSSLKAGSRISVDESKRNENDFVLWFTNSKFKNQELQWDSPWGRGYPGWHIECSAMSMTYLGEQFDIHCGGIDHIPVHHSNEIAQSEGATGKQFVQIWMHGAFLVLGRDKMSKSTGEFLTLNLVREREFDPLAYRLFCLGTAYRQELAWGWEALAASAKSLTKLRQQVLELRRHVNESDLDGRQISGACKDYLSRFKEAVFDDLGIPRALALLHTSIADSSLEPFERLNLVNEFDQVLGLGLTLLKDTEEVIPFEVKELAEQRIIARQNKDFKEADRLRDLIVQMGFSISDSKDGYVIKKGS